MRRLSVAFILVATLSGCDSGNVAASNDEKVTQVPMGDIDSTEGTISDEMINTDESTDEAPLDNSPVASAAKPKAEAAAKKKDEAKITPAPQPKPAETAAPVQTTE